MGISNELAYLLGALRDGNIQIGKNRKGSYYYLEFISKSKEWLENLEKILEKLCGRKTTIRPLKKGNKIYWRLRLRNKDFICWLKEFSQFKTPQSTWKLPKIDMNKENKIYYLSGFFDAEGYVSKSSNTGAWNIGIEHSWLGSRCYPLLHLKQILLELGIKSNKIVMKKKGRKTPLFRLRITDKNSILKFCKIVKSFHPEKAKKLKIIYNYFLHTKAP